MNQRDVALLAGYCCLLFGVSLVAGRPLTLHEAVLPQSAREMLADGDWIVPKKGGEPWLESPPLPQWCTVAVASLFGRCDAEWIVRIGPAMAATLTVLLTAWMASVWYGRTIGLISGLMLATMCQFTRYAWLAEDEIYLCALVTAAIAWFVRLEFIPWRGHLVPASGETDATNAAFMKRSPSLPRSGGERTKQVALIIFFVLLGLTNLAKGLMFGTAMALIPIVGWMVWNRDWNRLAKYAWLPGWLLFGLILAAWPLASIWREPAAADVWRYDLGGRLTGDYTEINQPWWYYAANLPWMAAPWTLVIPFGLAATWPAVKTARGSPERFLWAWAALVPVVFSIPGGKHHHYLLHALAPWAILSALGVAQLRAWLAMWPRWLVHPLVGVLTVGVPAMIGLTVLHFRDVLAGSSQTFLVLMILIPVAAFTLTWGLHHRQGRIATATVFSALLLGYAAGHWYAGQYVDTHRHDVALLRRTRGLIEDRRTLAVVDLSRAPLSGFLELFYLPETTRTVHNSSFLASDDLPNEFLLLTASGNVESIRQFGEVVELDQSTRHLKADAERSRLTLLSIRLHDDLARHSIADVRISPMQAMQRQEGPVLR